MLWVLLFLGIAVGGLAVLARIALGVWRSAGALLEELDVMASRAADLADLLAQVQVPEPRADAGPDLTSDSAWPGTVETYDDRGATAPGK